MTVSPRRLLAAIILFVVLAIAAWLFADPPEPNSVTRFDGDGAPNAESAVERGRYLALAGNCASCHTTAEQGFMAGGVAFETEFGRLYSTNITPDADTGIGGWSSDDFRRSMRSGVRPNGEHLYPAFPYTAFTRLTDADLDALFAYLQSIEPVRSENRPNELGFPYSVRALLGPWKKLYLDAGVFQPNADASDEWNRGAYLTEALAHCSACHSPRNALGAEDTDRAMSGGAYFDRVPGGTYQRWSAPNLTGAESGLGIWPDEELSAYLKTGRNTFVEAFGPMNEVIVNSTQHLDDADVRAMSAYLKSLPASEPAAAATADDRTLGMGRTQYNLHCGTCHLPTGQGDPEMAPRLGAGSLVVRAEDPASLINVILYAPESAHLPTPSTWLKPMDEFQYLLDDDEIAALASFVRHSWGNDAGRVSAEQVAEQR